MVDKELIENCFRKTVKPFVMNFLFNANYEGKGELDKTEFERDFDEILDLSIKALEAEPCGDAISRQAAIDALDCINGVEEVLRSLPPAQSELTDEQVIEYCKKKGYKIVAEDLFNPSVQPEPKEGHWIPHETPDGGVQYECSRCGVLWEFNDGSPEDNEVYFCPKCGAKMQGADT